MVDFDATNAAHNDPRAKIAMYSGLVSGHSYALVSCVELQNGSIRLCQLHNPWGSLEWIGDWCDRSPLWTPEIRRELTTFMNKERAGSDIEDRTIAGRGVFSSRNDGLCWISYDDLCKYCESITASFVRHPKYCPPGQIPWNIQRRKFYFDFDFVVPPCLDKSRFHSHYEVVRTPRNPVYDLIVEQQGEFVFSIHQTDRRIDKAEPYMDIGLVVLEYDESPIDIVQSGDGKGFKFLASTGKIVAERQRCSDPIYLKPGHYLIKPAARGNEFFDQWLANQWNRNDQYDADGTADPVDNGLTTPILEKITGTDELYFSEQVISAFKELFQHLDSGEDGRLNKSDFDQYFRRTGKPLLTDDEFYGYIRGYEPAELSKPLSQQGLSVNSFIEIQWKIFARNGNQNEQELLRDFKIMGFDNQLVLIDDRPCALVIHSTSKKYTLKGLPYFEK